MRLMFAQNTMGVGMAFSQRSAGFRLTCAVVMIGILLTLSGTAKAIEVDPELMERFKTEETAGYVIYFRAQANLSAAPTTGWKDQSEFINRALQENAARSQARVRSYLFGRRIPYRSFWTDNTIVVDRSDKDTFAGLRSFPEIDAIRSHRGESKDQSKIAPLEKNISAPDSKP